MPELPEVETVVRELRDEVLFKTIKSYNVYWNKTFITDSDYKLNGLQITELARKGKYITQVSQLSKLNKNTIF